MSVHDIPPGIEPRTSDLQVEMLKAERSATEPRRTPSHSAINEITSQACNVLTKVLTFSDLLAMLLVCRGAHEDDDLVVDGGLQVVELVLDPCEVTLHRVEVSRCHRRQVSVHLQMYVEGARVDIFMIVFRF